MHATVHLSMSEQSIVLYKLYGTILSHEFDSCQQSILQNQIRQHTIHVALILRTWIVLQVHEVE